MKLLLLIKLLFKYGIDKSEYMLAHYDEVVSELIKTYNELQEWKNIITPKSGKSLHK